MIATVWYNVVAIVVVLVAILCIYKFADLSLVGAFRCYSIVFFLLIFLLVWGGVFWW